MTAVADHWSHSRSFTSRPGFDNRRGRPSDVRWPARVARTVHEELENSFSVTSRPDQRSPSFQRVWCDVEKTCCTTHQSPAKTELGRCHLLHLPMFRSHRGDVVDGPGARRCVKRCPTLAELCLTQALGTASSGNSGVTASCSDREDKLLKSPFGPKLGAEGGDDVWVCSQTEVKDRPVCLHYAQKRRLVADVQLSHCILLTEPAEAGVSLNVSR